MSSKLGMTATLSQKQQLKLSPAQIQLIRMIELPSCDLQQRINEELQENPALEEGREPLAEVSEEVAPEAEEDYNNPLQNENFNYDDYISDDETPDYRQGYYSGGDDDHKEIPFSVGMSFGEYLKSQIYLTRMDKPQRHIAKFVVGNIDEDGYLRRSAQELVDDLYLREGIEVPDSEMKDIISEIQRFDPPGVGATSLQECLLIQLEQQNSTPAIERAKNILRRCMDDFTHRRYTHVCQRLQISEDDFNEALNEIKRLNPKPGSAWAGTLYDRQQTIVTPDFVVEEQDGQLQVSLNTGNLPELRISREYSNMLQDYAANEANQTGKMKEAVQFVQQKIDAARGFISAIQQRNATLLSTMRAIVDIQHDFFMEGEVSYLKPMILKDIAERTGYDISTISRVSNSKYVQTRYGIYPLKFFFSERTQNDQGEDISTREVKKMLKELIDSEDKLNPLNDDQMVELMASRGYQLARRTIAKYREQMGIPVARLRRNV